MGHQSHFIDPDEHRIDVFIGWGWNGYVSHNMREIRTVIRSFSRFGNLPLIWLAFVLAEAVVIPVGVLLWRKESGKVLKHLERKKRKMFHLKEEMGVIYEKA